MQLPKHTAERLDYFGSFLWSIFLSPPPQNQSICFYPLNIYETLVTLIFSAQLFLTSAPLTHHHTYIAHHALHHRRRFRLQQLQTPNMSITSLVSLASTTPWSVVVPSTTAQPSLCCSHDPTHRAAFAVLVAPTLRPLSVMPSPSCYPFVGLLLSQRIQDRRLVTETGTSSLE